MDTKEFINSNKAKNCIRKRDCERFGVHFCTPEEVAVHTLIPHPLQHVIGHAYEPQEHTREVRPCSIYKEEYSDCTSIRSRIHQYFVFGSTVDCTQWKHDENNCQKWKDDEDINALRCIVESETKRKEERMANHKANDVWSRRAAPPPEWNTPLPEWFQKREANSYLTLRAKEAKSGEPIIDGNQQLCTIL